jgi:hypothetical protein
MQLSCKENQELIKPGTGPGEEREKVDQVSTFSANWERAAWSWAEDSSFIFCISALASANCSLRLSTSATEGTCAGLLGGALRTEREVREEEERRSALVKIPYGSPTRRCSHSLWSCPRLSCHSVERESQRGRDREVTLSRRQRSAPLSRRRAAAVKKPLLQANIRGVLPSYDNKRRREWRVTLPCRLIPAPLSSSRGITLDLPLPQAHMRGVHPDYDNKMKRGERDSPDLWDPRALPSRGGE